MSWFKAHSGVSTDTKFLRVMRNTGADGARVTGIWLALLDHASTTSPRGLVDSFDADGYALWANLQLEDVQAIVNAFGPKESGGVGLHDGHRLVRWGDRQSKGDTTAAARMRRLRQRKKEAQGAPTAPAGDEQTERYGVTASRDGNSSHVTPPYREIEQSSSSHTSTSSCSSSSSDTSRDDACAGAMSAGEVWAALEESGVSAGFIARGKHRATIQSWVSSGLTRRQFDDAVDRATAARRDAGTPHLPLNVGFLNSVIFNPLERKARPAAKTYEDGDAISRQFAEG